MNYDIPLPVDLPAGAPNLAWWQVSCLQAVNDRFQSVAITGRANRECRRSTLLSRSDWCWARSEKGRSYSRSLAVATTAAVRAANGCQLPPNDFLAGALKM